MELKGSTNNNLLGDIWETLMKRQKVIVTACPKKGYAHARTAISCDDELLMNWLCCMGFSCRWVGKGKRNRRGMVFIQIVFDFLPEAQDPLRVIQVACKRFFNGAGKVTVSLPA